MKDEDGRMPFGFAQGPVSCGIDELIYELFGLTEEEIKIMEGSQDKKK